MPVEDNTDVITAAAAMTAPTAARGHNLVTSDALADLLEQVAGADLASLGDCSEGEARCQGKGYWKNENGTVTTCECSRKRIKHALYREAGVSSEFWGMTMEKWNTKQDQFGNDLGEAQAAKAAAGEIARKYINAMPLMIAGEFMVFKGRHGDQKRSMSLCLTGGARSGKSMIGAIAAQHALNLGFSAKVYAWPDVFNTLMNFRDEEGNQRLADDFGSKDFLVLDGVERYDLEHRGARFHLDVLASRRLRSNKPFLITRNLVLGADNDIRTIGGGTWRSFIESSVEIRLPGKVG